MLLCSRELYLWDWQLLRKSMARDKDRARCLYRLRNRCMQQNNRMHFFATVLCLLLVCLGVSSRIQHKRKSRLSWPSRSNLRAAFTSLRSPISSSDASLQVQCPEATIEMIDRLGCDAYISVSISTPETTFPPSCWSTLKRQIQEFSRTPLSIGADWKVSIFAQGITKIPSSLCSIIPNMISPKVQLEAAEVSSGDSLRRGMNLKDIALVIAPEQEHFFVRRGAIRSDLIHTVNITAKHSQATVTLEKNGVRAKSLFRLSIEAPHIVLREKCFGGLPIPYNVHFVSNLIESNLPRTGTWTQEILNLKLFMFDASKKLNIIGSLFPKKTEQVNAEVDLLETALWAWKQNPLPTVSLAPKNIHKALPFSASASDICLMVSTAERQKPLKAGFLFVTVKTSRNHHRFLSYARLDPEAHENTIASS